MTYRILALVAVVCIAALGLVAATYETSIAWRADLVEQKLTGDLPISWPRLALDLLPGALISKRTIKPHVDHLIAPLEYPLNDAGLAGAPAVNEPFDYRHFLFEPTSCVDFLDIHRSILQAGRTPHDLHQHVDEELIVPIEGEVDILRAADGAGTDSSSERIGPGQIVYHPANRFHTIRAVGPGPSSYAVFKWRSDAANPAGDELEAAIFDYAAQRSGQVTPGWTTKLVFEGPTRHLGKLHCHLSRLEPGAGYEPHADRHDIGILVLEGVVETLGERVPAKSAIFYASYKPHGMRNVGAEPATYLVFEFHAEQ